MQYEVYPYITKELAIGTIVHVLYRDEMFYARIVDLPFKRPDALPGKNVTVLPVVGLTGPYKNEVVTVFINLVATPDIDEHLMLRFARPKGRRIGTRVVEREA